MSRLQAKNGASQKTFLCTAAAAPSMGRPTNLVCQEIPQPGVQSRTMVRAAAIKPKLAVTRQTVAHGRGRARQCDNDAGDCQNSTDYLCDLNCDELEDALIEMRHLWEDHILYPRLAAEYAIYASPLYETTKNRLLANQIELGDNLAIFYGEANGAEYADILTEHILGAVQVVLAKIALAAANTQQNRTAVEAAVAAALANAHKFARFWACVNKYLSEQEVYDHFAHHIVALGNLMDALIAAEASPTQANALAVVTTHDLYAEATRDKYELFVRRVRKQWEKKCGGSRDDHKDSHDSTDCSDDDHHHRRR